LFKKERENINFGILSLLLKKTQNISEKKYLIPTFEAIAN